MNIHSILPEEIAAMGGHSNRVLNEKTGCIGYLTANLNASAPVFESSWHDRTPRLNTPEFTDDFNDMMDTPVSYTHLDVYKRQQRSWTRWMAEWLYDARKACKPGAPVCLFIDWRQYPCLLYTSRCV